MSEASDSDVGPKTLTELMGLAQSPIRWTGVAAFLLGNWALAVLGLLLRPDIGDVPPLYLWLGQAVHCILLTAAVTLGFRMGRSQVLSAVLATVFYSLVWWGLSRFVPFWPFYYAPLIPTLGRTLLFLLGLVFLLRLFRAPWLGLILGALAGQVAYLLSSTALHHFGIGFYYASSGLSFWVVIRALVFGGAFWGALWLFEKPKAGPGRAGPPPVGPA